MGLKRLEHIDADVKQYLLGQLSDDEQARIEQRVFANDDSHEKLLAFEEDLIDAYVGGELSAEDRAKFEAHFLSSDRRVQKVATARALAAGIEAVAREAVHRLEGQPRRIGWLIAAAGLAIITVGWFAFRGDRAPSSSQPIGPSTATVQTPQPSVPPSTTADQSVKSTPETTAPSSKSPSSSTPPAVVALTLVPGASRDITGGTRLVIPTNTDSVLVDVRFEPADYRSYTAVLRTVNDRVVRTDVNLQPKAIGNQMSVTLRWPAARLDLDDYLLTLSGVRPTGEREEIADYYFRIVR